MVLISIGLAFGSLALVAFTLVVAGVHVTERRKSLDDPCRDGLAARLARRVIGVSTCQMASHGDRDGGSDRLAQVRT